MAHLVNLAKERSARMKEWISRDPERALAQAISAAQYEALPEELQPWFERPFAAMATLRVLPVCSPGSAGMSPMRVLEMDGKGWQASVYGWRAGQLTKENTSLVGITLDSAAAISAGFFQVIPPEEAETAAAMPLGNPDPGKDFATGDALGGRAVVTVAAGKRYLFASTASLDETNRRMAALDESVAPKAGSNLVFALPSPGPDGGLGWEALAGEVEQQADAWSESPKNVFCIRVDFSDMPGQVVSQADLANVMNTSVTNSIGEMSYGKTSITATVSATTVRMPQPSTFYAPSKNTELHDQAQDAYKAIAGASSLNGYDIIVVHFASIGMQGSGLTYAGLAGGGDQWLQGTHSSGVIIHEFGHNYGIGHSSFWSTTNGTVVGAGTSVEYGDHTDIMGGGPDPEGHFHMQAKQKLGWLTAAQWQSATTSGTRRIYRFDSPATTGALRGVRITKAASPAQYYWVGFRPGLPTLPAFQQGAYLLWQRPSETRSWLIDTSPLSADGKDDAALPIGRTYSDTAANVHVTPIGKGGSGADQWLDVNVQIGPFAGNTAPTATLTASSSVAARSSVPLSATAADGNGDTLAYAWDFGDGTTGDNLPSVSHQWLVGGTYTVTLIVSDMKGGVVTKTQSITVTDPLSGWTTATVNASNPADRSAYLDGRFIVTGNKYAYSSFDGVSWKSQYLALNFRSGGMAWGNGRHVIAGFDYIGGDWHAAIFRSPDGFKWSAVSLPVLPELRGVAYGGGTFVAVGDDGTILRSTDGGTWTASAAPGTTSLRSVAYGGGAFVAVGGTSVYTSPDGVAWTDRSAGHSLPSWQSFDTVTYSGGKFLAGGWYSGIHASSNQGVTWSKTAIRGGHDYEVQNIVVGGGCIVASAVDKSESNTPALLVSIDGLSWTESPYASYQNTDALTFGGGVFLSAYGNPGTVQRSGGFFPANGVPTASISAPATGSARTGLNFSASTGDPNGDALTLAWDFKDGTALASGATTTHTFPVGGSYMVDLIATDTKGGVTVTSHPIAISDPLDNWTARTSGTSAALNDIAAGGGLLVAVGESGGTYRTSADGITWTGGAIGTNIYLRSVIHDGTRFVAVGQDYDFSVSGWKGAIYTSPNGSTWTRRLFSGPSLFGISSGAGVLVAVGDTGTIWRSVDSISWSPVPSGVTVRLVDISHGAGRFVTGGAGGTVLTSADGSSWTDRTSGTGLASWQDISEMEYLNDRFLGSGWYARIRHSTDLGNTFSTTETGERIIAGYAFGNGVYFAAGADRDNADADINLISTNGTDWTPLATTQQDDRRSAIFFNNTFITVGANGSIRQSAAITSPLSGFAAWTQVQFPGAPPLSGANDDYDGDGVRNLAEYATGTDPKDAADKAAITSVAQGGQIILSVPRDPSVGDVTVTGWTSTSLTGWTTSGVTILDNTPSLFRAAIPIGTGRSFLRAQFDAN